MVKRRGMRGGNKGKKFYSPRVGMILNIDRASKFIFGIFLFSLTQKKTFPFRFYPFISYQNNCDCSK